MVRAASILSRGTHKMSVCLRHARMIIRFEYGNHSPPEMVIEEPHIQPLTFVENENGKGKTRQRWDGDGVEI